jgi:hypothetical protein
MSSQQVLTDDFFRCRQAEVLHGSELVLSFDESLADDAGEYEVHVTNPSGTVVSRAEVKVSLEAPRFLLPLQDDNVPVQLGDDVTLPCRAIGIPMPEITWIFVEEVSGKEVTVSGNSSAFGERFLTKTSVELVDGRQVIATSLRVRKVKVIDSRIRLICSAENAVGKVHCATRLKPWGKCCFSLTQLTDTFGAISLIFKKPTDRIVLTREYTKNACNKLP